MHEEARPEGKLRRLEDWLTNVFWYHYRWYYIAAVFVATLVIVSAVSFIAHVDYDWTVVYAHAGQADPAGAAALKERFTQAGVEVNGDRKLRVKVLELFEGESPDRHGLYGLLDDADAFLYALDGPTAALYRDLGYFTEATEADGLLLAVNDAPVKPYTLAQFAEYNYTQDQIDEANAYRQEEHDKLAALARQVLENLAA